MKEYRIDPELNEVLPELSDEDYKALELSLLTDGYKGAPIMVWGDVIVDGHNRYKICNRHRIPYEVKTVEFEDKEEAMRWMVRQQIGRRTLTSLQRISIVERYKPFYKKKARENQLSGLKQNQSSVSQNSSKRVEPQKKIDVRAELAKDANVSTDTYSKGVKILQSEDEELINQTMSGQKSINKAYNELKQKQSDIQSVIIQESKQDEKEESPSRDIEKEQEVNVDDVEIKEMGTVDDVILLNEIKCRYNKFLDLFQQDIDWLSDMEFYQNDEEVSGMVHSDLKNCIEKFKGISSMIQSMTIDEFGISIK